MISCLLCLLASCDLLACRTGEAPTSSSVGTPSSLIPSSSVTAPVSSASSPLISSSSSSVPDSSSSGSSEPTVSSSVLDRMLSKAKSGMVFETDLEDRQYPVSGDTVGALTSDTHNYYRSFSSADYSGFETLGSQGGKAIAAAQMSGYVEREDVVFQGTEYPNAAVSLTMGTDGNPERAFISSDYGYSYPYAFDLLGAGDFLLDEEAHTATVRNPIHIAYFLRDSLHLDFTDYSMLALVFHYDPKTEAFTEITGADYTYRDTTENILHRDDLSIRLLPLTEDFFFHPATLSETEDSKALDAAFQSTATALAKENYSLSMTAVTQPESDTADYDYSTIVDGERGLAYQDVSYFSETLGVYHNFYARNDEGNWEQGILSESADIVKPMAMNQQYKDEAFYPMMSTLSGKLFEKKMEFAGETVYSIKDTRYLTNPDIYYSLNPGIDPYWYQLSLYSIQDLDVLVKGGKIVGYDTYFSLPGNGDYCFSYSFSNIGTSGLSQSIITSSDVAMLYLRAFSAAKLSNCTFTVSATDSSGKVTKTALILQGNAAEIDSVADDGTKTLIGYYGWAAESGLTTGYLWKYTYTDAEDGTRTWARAKVNNTKTASLLAALESYYAFPSSTFYTLYGKVSDDLSQATILYGSATDYALTVNPTTHYLLNLTNHKKKTSIDFSDYGKSPVETLPALA
jgi:hypothetical protein